MRRQRHVERAMPWLVTAGIFLLWELYCRVFEVPEIVLPRPTVLFASLVELHEAIVYHAMHTFYTTLIGFAIAVVFGLFLGLVVGANRLLYNGLYPVLVGFNSIPKVALVPVLVLWYGIGTVPAVLTAFLISFFPIVVNVATGLATLEPELRDVLRSLGAKQHQILLKVGLPRSLPYFFASLKVSITLAIVGSIISETVASNEGIGYLMISASARFDVPLVFASLLVVAAMGVALYAFFAVLERRLTGWAFRGNTGG